MAIRTNYQTVLTIDTATPISEGKMRADGGDIRIYEDAAHTEALDFYIDPTTLNTTATRIYIKQDLPTGRYLPSIVGYWPLDSDGTDLINGYNGTNTGVTFSTGQVDNAGDFTKDTSDKFTITATADLEVHEAAGFSVAGWINHLSGGVSTNGAGSIFRNGPPGPIDGFVLYVTGSGPYNLNYVIGYSTTDATAVSNGTIPVDTWTHFVATWDSTTDRCALYVNGAAVVLDTDTQGSGTVVNDSGFTVTIGNDTANGSAISGSLDDISAYRRTLTAEEARSLYLRGRAGKRLQEPTPTAYWTFNSSDNAGSEVVDLVGGNNGTINGGITVGQPSRVGQGFEFDGSTGYLNCGDITPANLYGASGQATFAATVRHDGDYSTFRTIFARYFREADANDCEFFTGTEITTGLPYIVVYGPGIANRNVSLSDTPLPIGKDTHITFVYDNTQSRPDQLKIYFDGVRVATTAADVGTFVDVDNKAIPTTIGAGQDNAPPVLYHWDGGMSDVLWCDTALTDLQIAELARRSKEGLRPDLTDVSLSPVAYWSFDNRDIGIEPQDVSGNGNHGTQVGSVQVGQKTAYSGESFLFPGPPAGNYISVPDDPIFDAHTTSGSGKVTWECAFNPNSLGGFGGGLFGKYNPVGDNREFDIYQVNGRISAFITALTPTPWESYNSNSGIIEVGKDYHVVVTYDQSAGAANRIKIYVNGIDETNPAGYSNSGTFTGMGSGTAPYTIGEQDSNTPIRPMDGFIEFSRYYGDIVFTPEQVLDAYNKWRGGGNAFSDTKRVYVTYGDTSKTSASSAANTFIREITGLVHAYKFDETNGGVFIDSVGGIDAEIADGIRVTKGIYGQARQFDGYASATATGNIFPVGAKTVNVRLRTTENDFIVCADSDGSTGQGDILEITPSGLVRYTNEVGGSPNFTLESTTAIDDGVLHTVSFTWDNTTSAGAAKLYIDGYEEDTATAIATESSSNATKFSFGDFGVNYSMPDSIANLELWFRADSIPLPNNTVVGEWKDQSVSGNDATNTQATSTWPVLIANGLNSLPVVRFDGTDDILRLAANPFNTVGEFPKTIFALLKSNAASGLVVGHGSSSGGFIDTYHTGLNVRNSHYRLSAVNNGVGEQFEGTTNVGGFDVVRLFMQSGSSSIYVNGLVENTGTGSMNPFNYSLASIGAADGSASNAEQDPFNGDIAEILVFNRILTTQEAESVESYLFGKYKLKSGVRNQFVGTLEEILVFNKALSANEVLDIAENFAEPAGSRAQIRKRNDPEPVLNTSL